MKKRLLAALMAGAMALTMTACGGSSDDSNAASGSDSGSAGSYKVGIVQLVQHEALDAATQGFQDKLKELVEADGGSVEFDPQNASGESANCTTIVNGFVSEGVDLIMANATAALQAAQAGTSDIPILGTSVPAYGPALRVTARPGKTGPNSEIVGNGPAPPAPTSPVLPILHRSTVRLICSRSCSRMPRT